MEGFKKFGDWKYEDVAYILGIKRVFEHPLLEDWLSANHKPPEQHLAFIEELRKELFQKIDSFNEEELKVYFIGPFIRLIPFWEGGRRPFLDRQMSFEYVDGKKTSGKVDWMLAEGIQNPTRPYFFLHEYKKELDASGDPLGQLLISMIGAKKQNEIDFPLYGCYVTGRNWFFVVYDGEQYAVSNAFNAADQDILKIYSYLKEVAEKVKQIR
ncbi:MAG: hypothetical protein AAGG68_30270 [Bacteroidota bacterium]